MKSAADNLSSAAPDFMKIHPEHSDWFSEFKKSEPFTMFAQGPVAYFCAEYALDSSLPTYAGGLGVLAGDFVREAAIQGFPLAAVGLFYRKAQSILSPEENGDKSKLKTLTDKDNQEITVQVPIEGRQVVARAWQWEEDKAKVYLLDTDIPENDPRDRGITRRLYDEDRDIRLKQEIILGIGGFRLLARLGYHASVYHLNEGHSAFLALELVRHEIEHQGVGFDQACQYAKKHVLFTNHTLVPEGQERFLLDKVASFMARYAEEMGIQGEDIARLGVAADGPNLFSMTALSFNLSTKSNTVSKFHFEQAGKVWPGRITDSATNGIFVKRWDKVGNGGNENIWERHLENKRKLLALVEEKSSEAWNDNDLIFVWARRLVEYKQPLMFLDTADELLEILKNSPVPVRLVFSGPTGELENPLDEKVEKIITEKLGGTAVFLPNYNTAIAEILTAGADVWLNTPVPGTEACGTSGMKAGLNGALSLSTNDGWVHEVEPSSIGWVENDNQPEKILFLIREKIIPLYHEHLRNPENSAWTGRMETLRNLILKDFSASRMLREYIEKLYIPVLQQKHRHKIDAKILP